MAITAPDLLARIDAQDAPTILDVRSADEFGRGHVPGAIHIAFATIGARLSEIPASRHEEIVVYCGHGPRAWIAGSVLRRNGFENVVYLKGHMRAWRLAGCREERTS